MVSAEWINERSNPFGLDCSADRRQPVRQDLELPSSSSFPSCRVPDCAAAGLIRLGAALMRRRTTEPMMARARSICAATTRRAESVRGVLSPNPTVEKTVMVE